MKTLKVGQRIRIEGVVTEISRSSYHHIRCDECYTTFVINQSEADQAEIISEAEPEPDKWEVNNPCSFNIMDQRYDGLIIAIAMIGHG